MTMVNAFDPHSGAHLSPETKRLLARRRRLLGPSYRLFYERPVHFVRGEGVWLFDPEGNKYLDAYNNVASVGHCHPHVVEAIAGQASKLNTHTRYLDDTLLDYAERLLATFPSGYRATFTCTGSEANDLALRVARHATGRRGVIVTRNAYHGVTQATSEISPSLGAAMVSGSTTWTIPAPGLDDPHGTAFAAGVGRAATEMARADCAPAALLVDTIFSSDGLRPAPDFLKSVATEIRAAGGLFIADEVQAGFGRTGSDFWGFARHGLQPDLVTMGKPMGNGHPIAAMVGKADLLEDFGRSVRYFNTFGGNQVACAAAAAVLDVIEGDALLSNARDTGSYLLARVRETISGMPAVGDIRGAGLFVAADMVDDDGAPSPERAAHVVNFLRDRRVLISASGSLGDTLKIRPPLVFGRDHVDLLVEALADAISSF